MATSKRRRDTHTIQLWPGGRSVEYYGDPNDGEYNREGGHKARQPRRRGLRDPGLSYLNDGGRKAVPVPNRWRRGTPAEWRAIRIEERARLYQEREILGCDSALVGDLLEASARAGIDDRTCDLRRAFDQEEIENLYQDPSDWDAAQCREYASEHGIDLPEVPTHGCPNCEGTGDKGDQKCDDCGGSGQVPDPDAEEDDRRHGWLTEAREACRDHAQDNPAEVFEWWRVSSWLVARLREIGEVVIDNRYGCWWGRCCTGQQYIMDGVLQRIARGQDQDQTEYGKGAGDGDNN